MSEINQELPISADLLEILRDPAAVQEPEKYGPDPGKLELVYNSWLVSADTGYKYPIKDGIPVMLIEEGERWKDTPIEELPMPPESADPLPTPDSTVSDLFIGSGEQRGLNYGLLAAGLLLVGVLVIALILRKRNATIDESTPD
jgi:uncharacterized protein YbaR (Trm112 family)